MLSAVSLWCAQCSLSVACSVQFLCGMLSVVSLWHAQCSFFVVCSVQFVCGMLSAVSLWHAQCSFFALSATWTVVLLSGDVSPFAWIWITAWRL